MFRGYPLLSLPLDVGLVRRGRVAPVKERVALIHIGTDIRHEVLQLRVLIQPG